MDLKRKIKANGTIEKYKARLVKIFKQQEGMIYIYIKNNFHMNINSHHDTIKTTPKDSLQVLIGSIIILKAKMHSMSLCRLFGLK
jgi:hypothetical protein